MNTTSSVLETLDFDLKDEQAELPLVGYTTVAVNYFEELSKKSSQSSAPVTLAFTSSLKNDYQSGDHNVSVSASSFQSILPVQADAFGSPTSAATVTATGDNNIDGLLATNKWASTSVSFSFTDSIDDYESDYANRESHAASFQTLNATQRAVARAWIGSGGAYYNVSLLRPYELTGASDRDATIRMAMSNVPSTAFAYLPSRAFVEAGDAWFNRFYYNNPVIGSSAYLAFGHELGHALGLKHGHETDGVRHVAMNSDRDSMEFSIMTYRSYVGHNLTALPYYTNETWGYAQSLMMYDIAAIQHMYGASFGYNSTNTTYTFSTTTGEMFINGVEQGTPGANRIFRTIWDGNGTDTYDFSNYTTNLSIDLTPGGWSDLDVGGNSQRAMLNVGLGGITKYARAHVFNALQYHGDARSLIENANGGSGNDIINGNSANNVLNGNGGNDTIKGGTGADTIYGGTGNDTVDGGDGNDLIYLDGGNDTIKGGTGADTIYGGTGNDTVDGGDGNDLIYLDDGNDYLNNISSGNDTFYGGNGNDFIFGYTGNETYYGEAGDDTLLGSSGNDNINGGAGDDSLTGGSGIDTLWGSTGADKFDFNYLSEGIDIIKDFQWTEYDKIQVSEIGFGATELSQFTYNSLTGALFFDPSGATGPTQFVTIENKPSGFATSLDIVIV